MPERPVLAGYVLTRNEEASVGRAVASLRSVCDHVLVVDSQSTDRTVAVASSYGATVVARPFDGFSAQRNFAVHHLAETVHPDYVLALDADEWLDAELVADLRHRAAQGRLAHDVYLARRRIWFDGRLLRWGGFANTWLPRMFRPAASRYEDRRVNEHLSTSPKATVGRLRGHVVHADVTSWEDHIAKHNRYSTLEAQARVALLRGEATATGWLDALRFPYLRRRWLRERVWNNLPARPALRFVQIYLLAGGLLDGRPGFRRALFEAWQEMCTDLKEEALARRLAAGDAP